MCFKCLLFVLCISSTMLIGCERRECRLKSFPCLSCNFIFCAYKFHCAISASCVLCAFRWEELRFQSFLVLMSLVFIFNCYSFNFVFLRLFPFIILYLEAMLFSSLLRNILFFNHPEVAKA